MRVVRVIRSMGVFARHAAGMCAIVVALTFIAFMFMLGRAYSAPCSEQDGRCWENYYSNVLNDEGVEVALTDLKKRFTEGGGAKTFCHPILHIIGAHAATEYGSLAEAFTHGDPVCRAGYYHGVLEGIFGEDGSDKLLNKLDGICAEIPGRERYSYEYFSCVHGVGHGLMAYFDHDVFASLKGCDGLSGLWERESCYGGVFMQNVMNDTAERQSEFLKPDEPLYPCTAVSAAYRTQCYLMQSSYVLKASGGDFTKTFAACEGTEIQYRRICFESIGRDVSGIAAGGIETALTLCGLSAGEGYEACIVGAAVDFMQSVDVPRAYELCRASGSAASVCTDAVLAQERML